MRRSNRLCDVPHTPLMEINTDPRVKIQLGDPMVAIFDPIVNIFDPWARV